MEPQANTASAPIVTPGANEPKPDTQPTRKRRGRPFAPRTPTTGATPLSETPVNPDAQPEEPSTRKRRAKGIDSDVFAKQLKGIHALAAKILPVTINGKPLLELDDTEAKLLADAVSAVAKEYDIDLGGGKAGVTFNLIAVACMVYGPRIYVIQKLRTQSQQQAQSNGHAQPDGTVIADVPSATAN